MSTSSLSFDKPLHALTRSTSYDGIHRDVYGFRDGLGVTAILVGGSRFAYNAIMFSIERNNDYRFVYPNDLRDIMENKWFIHAYDINDLLN